MKLIRVLVLLGLITSCCVASRSGGEQSDKPETTEAAAASLRSTVLPRVFYYTECSCSGASQEASNLLLGLSDYNINGKHRKALRAERESELFVDEDDDDAEKFIAFWLSAGKCPTDGVSGRCKLGQARQRALFKDLEKNAKLNFNAAALENFHLSGPLASVAEQTLFNNNNNNNNHNNNEEDDDELDAKDVEKIVKQLAGKHEHCDDVEYGARVLQYIESQPASAVIVSHHSEERLLCPVAEHFFLTSPSHSIGAAIFGSWWPGFLASVDSMVKAFLPTPTTTTTTTTSSSTSSTSSTTSSNNNNNLVHVCRVSYPTERLPVYEVRVCNSNCDVIVVPSEWHRRVFVSSGVDEHRLQVIPTAIDLDFFDAGEKEKPKFRTHVFLAVISSSGRKNWKTLLDAYYTAFSREEAVEFVIKVESERRGFNPKYTMSMFSFGWAREHDMDVEELPKVTLITKSFDQKRMRSLYASANTYVSASHGESLCMSLGEAMAMGLSVIAPDWGMFREYVRHEDNGLLVDVVGSTPSSAQYDHTPWAQLSSESLVRQMQWMAQHRAESHAMGLRARQTMEDGHSLQEIAAKWVALFNHTAPSAMKTDRAGGKRASKAERKAKEREEKEREKEEKEREKEEKEREKEEREREEREKKLKEKEEREKKDKNKDSREKEREKEKEKERDRR